MTTPQDDQIESGKVSQLLQNTFQEDLSSEADQSMNAVFAHFREDLENHPYIRKLDTRWNWFDYWRSGFLFPRVVRMTGLVGAGAVLAWVLVPVLIGKGTPTWAEVVERFRSVQSYSAVIYARKDVASQPVQYELWANANGQGRLHTETQVIFIDKGRITYSYDVDQREESTPGIHTMSILEVLGSTTTFSLETLMRAIGGDWKDSTPRINADAVVSEDLVVFDVQDKGSENWARVWALRESKLPIHLRSWEPHDGECVDVFFSYSRDQSSEFYDPAQFAEKLKDQSLNESQLAYAFLEDPGDKQVRSGAVNESFIFSTVTTTLAGEPWSLGDHKGKVVLIGFWSSSSGYDYEDWWREIYRDYGARNDLVMVGVALDKDAGAVHTYCKEHGIEWLQLHEPGKGRLNSLAQAFGGHVESTNWLIWKDGRVEPLGHGGYQVKAALLGLSYGTHSEITPLLSHRIGDGKGMSREEVRALCGEPNEKTTQDGSETWTYRLISDDNKEESTVTVTFDSTGKNTGIISQNSIIHPALVKVFISDQYWHDKIAQQIKPDLIPAQSHRFGITIVAKSGNTSYFFGGGHPWIDVEPGKEYLRQVLPGTYDISIVVSDKRTFEKGQEISLEKGIELNTGETKEVRLE